MLFLDDHHIDRLDGAQRVLHRPRKQGAVLRPEHPWEGNSVAVFSPPLWIDEEGVYKQFYECRFDGNETNDGHTYAIAISTDGITWEKPEIGAVHFRGSARNNLYPTPEDRRLAHVTYDPDDPDPQRRYKGLQTVRGLRLPVVSPDGVHWTRTGVELPSGDAGTLTFQREPRRFLALLKRPNAATVGRSYDVSISDDFDSWSAPRHIFGMDRQVDQQMAVDVIRRRLADPSMARPLFVDPAPDTGWSHERGDDLVPTWRCECYNFGVVPWGDLYLGLATVYYPTGQRLPERSNADGFNEIQLAVSRDLQTWTRVAGRAPWLQTSPLTEGLVGNYDRLQLAAHNGLVRHGDEVRFYYDGMKRRVPQHDRWVDGSPRSADSLTAAERADWLDDAHSAMCLATLPRDRFVSLRAGAAPGHLLTRPFEWTGSALHLNVGSAASIHAQLLDDDGSVLDGLGEVNLHGAGLDVPVPFPAARLRTLEGRRVRLRLRWCRGDLYGVSLT